MKEVRAFKLELPSSMFGYSICPHCGNENMFHIEMKMENGYLTCDKEGEVKEMCDSCLKVYSASWKREDAVFEGFTEISDDE